MKSIVCSLILLGSLCLGCGFENTPQQSGTGGSGGGSIAGTAGSSAGSGGTATNNADAGGTGGAAGISGSDGGQTDGGASDVGFDPNMPKLLSQTGLFSDIAKGTLAPNVFAYQPQYALWSDGATKRRWVSLPVGSKIDTSSMDYWDYPAGTKLWKEFTRDGVRVETRLLMKRGSGLGDWLMVAYKWNSSKTEATAVPDGEANASGTQHDIPSQKACSTCHSALSDNVLGFTAAAPRALVAGAGRRQGLAYRCARGRFRLTGQCCRQSCLWLSSCQLRDLP